MTDHPFDLQVAICNVHIRHGLLMLVPEAFEVLGGLVEELEAARLRLVDEINKPPRGKRYMLCTKDVMISVKVTIYYKVF